ncbi:MAG TPA: SPOR domain-containing protein [Methylomirabilota bacterium]|nr:SPOR domain-containing protein [Methylomirabilota bacterium]
MKDSNFMEPDPLRPPSVFTARWFRLLLVFLFLLLVAVVGLPYLLEWTAPTSPLVLTPPVQPVPPPAVTTQPETPTPPPSTEKAKEPPQEPGQATPSLPPVEKAPVAREASTKKAGYAVQVGAFQNAANAKRLASRLKEEKLQVEQLTVSRPDRTFQVIASGASSTAVSDKMRKLGLEGKLEGATFTISKRITLKEAVLLSERLKEEGLDVKVKTLQNNVAYHLVRVGGFPDVKSAESARKDLEAKGITGLVVAVSSR